MRVTLRICLMSLILMLWAHLSPLQTISRAASRFEKQLVDEQAKAESCRKAAQMAGIMHVVSLTLVVTLNILDGSIQSTSFVNWNL